MTVVAVAWYSGGLFQPIVIEKKPKSVDMIRETLKFLAWQVANKHGCYDSLLGNRLVNLGICKQQHLYLKTKNLI